MKVGQSIREAGTASSCPTAFCRAPSKRLQATDRFSGGSEKSLYPIHPAKEMSCHTRCTTLSRTLLHSSVFSPEHIVQPTALLFVCPSNQTILFWYPCEISGAYILVVVDIPASYVRFTALFFELGVRNPAGIVANLLAKIPYR